MIKQVIPKGSIFFFSSGQYSDYRVNFIAKALKDMDVSILKKEYLMEYPRQAEEYGFEENKFINWLSLNGYFEKIDHHEFHLTDYSRISEMKIR